MRWVLFVTVFEGLRPSPRPSESDRGPTPWFGAPTPNRYFSWLVVRASRLDELRLGAFARAMRGAEARDDNERATLVLLVLVGRCCFARIGFAARVGFAARMGFVARVGFAARVGLRPA